jgi:hypothetical protein
VSYEQLTLKSPSLLRRLSHRGRYTVAINLLDPQPGDRIFDYGTGDGELLVQLVQRQPSVTLCAYEPTAWCLAEASEKTRALTPVPKLISAISQLGDFRPNKIACLEVIEHLPPRVLEQTLQHFAALMKDGARLVISVPIEVGPTALIKYAVRRRGNSANSRSLRDLWNALLGRTQRIPRCEDAGYISSHFGFDYRALPALFRDHGLAVEREVSSPVPWLGPWFNSQQFYVLTTASSRRGKRSL